MEILKRAKGNSGEMVPFGPEPSGFKDEINLRTYKAGYTDRDGQPRGAGKGDAPRPVNKKRYDENYDRIFKKK